MLTNPSTLGLFDRNARRACELLHEAGAAKTLILRWQGTVIYPQEVPACAC